SYRHRINMPIFCCHGLDVAGESVKPQKDPLFASRCITSRNPVRFIEWWKNFIFRLKLEGERAIQVSDSGNAVAFLQGREDVIVVDDRDKVRGIGGRVDELSNVNRE